MRQSSEPAVILARPADLVDLAEPVAVDLVHEDDGRRIVALRIEGLGRGIGDAFKRQSL